METKVKKTIAVSKTIRDLAVEQTVVFNTYARESIRNQAYRLVGQLGRKFKTHYEGRTSVRVTRIA